MTLAQITDKTGLPLGLVISLMLIAAGGVGSFVKTQADVSHLESDLAKETAKREEVDRQQQAEQTAQGKAIIEYRADSRHILETLGEIKAALGLSGNVRPVRAHP